MKITNSRSSDALFIYFGAAVLVIVNGQPTTDDVVDRYQNTELRAELAKAVDRISKLERLLAAAGKKIDTKQDASKLYELTSRLQCESKNPPP